MNAPSSLWDQRGNHANRVGDMVEIAKKAVDSMGIFPQLFHDGSEFLRVLRQVP